MTEKKPKKKQPELPGMASPKLRDMILEASELKEQIGDQADKLKEKLDDIRKELRDQGKKSVRTENEEGKLISVNLKSIGERVSISHPKDNKEVGEKKGENLGI